MFRHISLKRAVLGFIISLQERTVVPQPQKVNCSHKQKQPLQWGFDLVFIQSYSGYDHTTAMILIYKTAHCFLFINTERDWGGKIQSKITAKFCLIDSCGLNINVWLFLHQTFLVDFFLHCAGYLFCDWHLLCLHQIFHRGQSVEMALLILLILTSLCIVGREALSISDCGVYARRPGEMLVNSTLWF